VADFTAQEVNFEVRLGLSGKGGKGENVMVLDHRLQSQSNGLGSPD